jgi:hypothetical protein
MEPQLGEIWQNDTNLKHILIIDRYEEEGWLENKTRTKWKFIYLINNKRDAAYIEYFDYHCSKVA